MNSFIRKGSKVIGLAAFLVLAPAFGAATPIVYQGAGQSAGGESVDQVAVIAPATQSVAVYRDETVTFIVEQNGQSFSWCFDTMMPSVDLNLIAPEGALAGQHVTVYVRNKTDRSVG